MVYKNFFLVLLGAMLFVSCAAHPKMSEESQSYFNNLKRNLNVTETPCTDSDPKIVAICAVSPAGYDEVLQNLPDFLTSGYGSLRLVSDKTSDINFYETDQEPSKYGMRFLKEADGSFYMMWLDMKASK